MHPAGERRDASAFFAENASWLRYDLAVAGGTVRADVISSESESTLATFGTVAFADSPARALVRVDRVAVGAVDAQVWHFLNGSVDVAWLTPVKTASGRVTEQVVLSGRDRPTLLSLARALVAGR